MTTTSD